MEDFNIVLNLMEKNGVSQRQLADCLGVGESKVSDWRAGRLRSWLKYIDKIAVCIGVTVGDCLGIEQKEKPTDLLDGLKSDLYKIMSQLQGDDLSKLLEHAELLEAARRSREGY